jgi:amidase
VIRDPGGLGVDPEVAAGVDRAAGALADAGYDLVEAEPPVMEGYRSWRSLIVTEIRLIWPFMQPMVSPGAQTFMAAFLETEPPLDLAGYATGFANRLAILRAWSEFQASQPLILGPVSTNPPFPVGRDVGTRAEILAVADSMRLTVAVNNLGLPAVALPVGIAGGMPQGVQVIGPRFREDLCLDAALAIEARLGVITPIDPR